MSNKFTWELSTGSTRWPTLVPPREQQLPPAPCALPPRIRMTDDPRLRAAIEQLNAGDYAEAADALEELFFEAVRDEVEPVRALMQIATGMHHIERPHLHLAQRRSAG